MHVYDSEGAALAFVRDVVLVAGRQAAAQFQLTRTELLRQASIVGEDDALGQRALEDRVL